MSFKSTILVVKDVLQSRKLYETILGCKVDGDFGIYNVGFEGGLSLYKKSLFEELTGNVKILERAHNFVTYFEVGNIEEIEKNIEANGFEFLHKTREQPWGQREFRFYDYDNHLVEIAENMSNVFDRMNREGKSVAEMAQKTGYTEEQVVEEIAKLVTSAGAD
jgi:catechol 2,3-dioxygenase-like lactoylglutathione lyase family enzyme